MHLFRKLAENIFFKIILAFVALTFVLFGVSGFILGSPNSWVAKIGDTTIGYSSFNNAMKADREAILSANKSKEALQYLDSPQFKSDVLGRIVNKEMITKLHEEYGVEASEKLILQMIAKNPAFKKDGKFSHQIFEDFLKKNGINEKKYVDALANEIVATMIMQTLSMVSPLNEKMVKEVENFKKQKRFADLITISLRDIKSALQPKEKELEEFFAENKKNYFAPKFYQISYFSFSKDDFVKDLEVKNEEILAEYKNNKQAYKTQEERSFYHILFDKEDDAKSFAEKLNGKKNLPNEFFKLAQETQKKDKKSLTLKASKNDLIPEISNKVFALKKGDLSQVLSSPLGYHVFLLNEVNESKEIPFEKVKKTIKENLSKGRVAKIMQDKITQIDDKILSSNSLKDVAKSFNLKVSKSYKIDQNFIDENDKKVKEVEVLDNFVQNIFPLKKGQISKIFQDEKAGKFYVVQMEDVIESKERSLKEIKQKVVADLLLKNRQKMMMELANKVADEVKENPENITKIASKYRLKLERNKEFPRIYYIDYQGQKIPYQNKFLDELFSIKIGQATSLLPGNAQEFVIGVLRKIENNSVSSKEFEEAKNDESQAFIAEVMKEFNAYLLKKHPVEINEKLLGQKEE